MFGDLDTKFGLSRPVISCEYIQMKTGTLASLLQRWQSQLLYWQSKIVGGPYDGELSLGAGSAGSTRTLWECARRCVDGTGSRLGCMLRDSCLKGWEGGWRVSVVFVMAVSRSTLFRCRVSLRVHENLVGACTLFLWWNRQRSWVYTRRPVRNERGLGGTVTVVQYSRKRKKSIPNWIIFQGITVSNRPSQYECLNKFFSGGEKH